jgi:predicted nucleotidyltransferase
MKSSAISPDQMEVYRATARRRWQEEQEAKERRRNLAWEMARRAASLLREQFGASRVMLFGSLAQGRSFSRWSDLDLAAWGLQPDDYFVAVARLHDLSPEFKVDLVAMEHCRPDLQRAILGEGRVL